MTLHLSESFSWNLTCALCNIEEFKTTHCRLTWKLFSDSVWCKYYILFQIQQKNRFQLFRFAKPSCICLTPTGRNERYLTEIWVIVTFVWLQCRWSDGRILLLLLMVSSIPKLAHACRGCADKKCKNKDKMSWRQQMCSAHTLILFYVCHCFISVWEESVQSLLSV